MEFDPELLPGQFPLPLDWKKVYGRAARQVVEIGSGKGTWLIRFAEQHPELNVLGIELAASVFHIMRARVAKRRLSNMRVSQTDGADLVTNLFSDGCVDEYHIYFPDPWHKKRHFKRRLLSLAFCKQLFRTLAPGGKMYFATDHAGYLEEVLPNLQQALGAVEHPEPWPGYPLGRTNYEIKYLREGRPIYRYLACKPL